MRPACGALLLAVLAGCAHAAPPGASAPAAATGSFGEAAAVLDGTEFQVFTWRPAGCRPTAALLLFHGANRDVIADRDDVVPLAQRYCLVVAEPLFDHARFRDWSYQHGGIVHGTLQPPGTWTTRTVPALADWVRRQEGRPDLPYVQVGHSAGGQFLSRVVAYSPDTARRTIIANPSSWVMPSLDVPAPYGFGGIPDGEAALRRYLGAHVAVLLGSADIGSHQLERSLEAGRQGPDRFQRGQAAFQAAREAALAHGWAFNWTLAVVPGVGHQTRAMLQSDAAFVALRGAS